MMKLLIITVVFLFSVNIYGLDELNFSSYYLASNDSADNADRSVSNVETINQGQYIAGGVIGTVFGFGIGHAVQGRWTKTGWIHTALQVGATGVLVAGYMPLIVAFLSDTKGNNNVVLSVIGSIVLLGAKVWEIVDVWAVPSSMKVVSQNRVVYGPTLYSQHNQGHFLGMKLQYNF